MKISFVIPSYGKPELAKKCLNSLRQYHPDNEVIVVDDGSSFSEQIKLKAICKKYNSQIICNHHNNGYGFNCNEGLYRATGDIIVTVNNDITFSHNIEKELIKAFNLDEKIAIVGCLLYYPDGRIQHGGMIRFPNSNQFGHYDHGARASDAKMSKISRYCIGVTGALQAFRKTFIEEAGAFKRGYFLAYEDAEICLRAWNLGYKVYYSAKISAIHHEGFTRGRTIEEKSALGTLEGEMTSMLQYYKDIVNYRIEESEELVEILNSKIFRKKRIGINRTGALGDCIMASGIIEKLKADNPNADIYFCCHQSIQDTFRNNPNIHMIFSDKERLRFLCDEVYDLDMVYENDPKKPIWIAFADHCFPEGYQESEVKPVLYSTEDDKRNMKAKLISREIKPKFSYIVIHPAISWPSKNLTQELWQKVINYLKFKYPNTELIVIGTSRDLKLDNVHDCRNLFTISEIRELIKEASLFIGIDSGLAHVAMTTATKIISIFSIANPDYFIHRKAKTKAIIPNTVCKYCRHDKSGLTFIECKHQKDTALEHGCIKSITYPRIIKAIREIL